MRRITHVIFDLDGTLLDTEPLYFRAYQEVMARYGYEYTLEGANALRGIPTSVGVPRLLAETQLPLDVERFIEQLEEILFRLYPTAQPTEGALRLTEHLKCEGVPIAIATSSNARQLASKFTAHQNWLGSFRAVVCADEVENGKPAPDLFIEAARRLGASPPRCLVFEDAPAGVAAARAASMAVVAIPEDGFGEAVADADLVIPSLAVFDPEPWGLPPFEDCSAGYPHRSERAAERGVEAMAYAINHIHLKSNDPKASADWWVQAFGFTIASDTTRPVGDRFIAMDSQNGVRVNISEALPGQTLAPGDAGVHEGIEHFGLDSEDLEADIERLTGMGAEVLQGPTEMGAIRICFLKGPDNVRIELIQRAGG